MVMNFRPEVDQFFKQTHLEAYKAERRLTSANKRYLIHKGKLQSLPMTIGRLFLSPLWSTAGKFRLLMEPFILKGSHHNETVTEFITRRFGAEFLEKAMEPFISGTLASDPDLACAHYVIPRLTALEKKYGSITAGIFAHKILRKRTARNPESFSFKGGMETLIKKLRDNPEINFQSNCSVQKIIQHGSCRWEVQAETVNGDVQCKARHVVISSPAETAATLLSPLNNILGEALSNIEYAPLSVIHLGYESSAIDHPLDSAGFLVPRQEKMNINGNLWMSSIFSGLTTNNNILLSSYLGGAHHSSVTQLSHQQSIDQVIKKTLAGLHIEANYKGGVSIRDRIVSAEKTANKIIHLLRSNDQAESTVFFNPSLRQSTA